MQGVFLRFKFDYELGYCLMDLLVAGLTLVPHIAAYGLIDRAALVAHGVRRWIGREYSTLSPR
jgi:hypothetical protein